MPELPEVETIRSGLDRVLPGKQIAGVTLLRPATFPDAGEALLESLVGDSFLSVTRRAKYLLLELASGRVLLVHLKMSGTFYFFGAGEEAHSRFARFAWVFTDGSQLLFDDMRVFGKIWLFASSKLLAQDSKFVGLALEPFSAEFTESYFKKSLLASDAALKPLLLDQRRVVVGLGNIYVDESLHRAGLHPLTVVNTLKANQVKLLYRCILETLSEAIELGGTTIKDHLKLDGKPGYFANKLRVYGRKGEACFVCASPIIKTRVVGRGTHFCAVCQVL